MPAPSSEDADRGWAGGSDAAFVIAHAAGGDGLGTIGLHLFADDAGLAAVGYWLRREARGHGAATIAVRLVSGWAFDELGIKRLNLDRVQRQQHRRRQPMRIPVGPGPQQQLIHRLGPQPRQVRGVVQVLGGDHRRGLGQRQRQPAQLGRQQPGARRVGRAGPAGQERQRLLPVNTSTATPRPARPPAARCW